MYRALLAGHASMCYSGILLTVLPPGVSWVLKSNWCSPHIYPSLRLFCHALTSPYWNLRMPGIITKFAQNRDLHQISCLHRVHFSYVKLDYQLWISHVSDNYSVEDGITPYDDDGVEVPPCRMINLSDDQLELRTKGYSWSPQWQRWLWDWNWWESVYFSKINMQYRINWLDHGALLISKMNALHCKTAPSMGKCSCIIIRISMNIKI